MKKYLGGLISIVCGGLTFLFLSIANITLTAKVLGNEVTSSINGWEILKNYDGNTDGYILAKIGIIASIVVAGLLIIYGLFLLLNSFGVIETKKINFSLISNCLNLFFVASTVLTLIGTIVMSNYFSGDLYVLASKASPAIGVFMLVGVSIAGIILSILFPVKNSKKHK